ncbi:MAG: hypothetical protein MnENMB40S_01150 [Rhizobiaceae bacterium MnEN-MB40S]|nr:MAG: hypothetical protein MnENMB40S_01150 [Rhizobiaceae bacterium MnEN-MB40S]
MSDLQELLTGILLVAGATLFVALFTAPFEAMTWWSRWTTTDDGDLENIDGLPIDRLSEDPAAINEADDRAVVVYVTGIGTITGDSHPPLEANFLDELKKAIPYATVIQDFFPYSPMGIPLTGQRIFGWFWRYLGGHSANVAKNLIRLRNMFQVLVAADGRYGPIYSAGTYQVIRKKLYQSGQTPGSHRPVILLGYSGGAEVSVGAAPFLRTAFKARLSLFSLGGVLSSHSGLSALDDIVHIQGTADRVARIGAVGFIHRWRIFAKSYWNEARREGRITRITFPGVGHNGPNGYLDDDSRPAEGQPSNMRMTVDAIKQMVDNEIAESERDRNYKSSTV